MPEPSELCEDCPPVNYPTDATRCGPCPRRTTPFVGHNLHLEPNPLAPPRHVSGFIPPREERLDMALKIAVKAIEDHLIHATDPTWREPCFSEELVWIRRMEETGEI